MLCDERRSTKGLTPPARLKPISVGHVKTAKTGRNRMNVIIIRRTKLRPDSEHSAIPQQALSLDSDLAIMAAAVDGGQG